MVPQGDPFIHCPGLRDLIKEPGTSFFRNFDPAALARDLEAKGIPTDWWTSEADREAGRRAFLDQHVGDLWVFGYGSLMWDPGFHFEEVRRATVSGYARGFILKDIHGGRGDRQRPGLMVALDHDPDGPGCHGLAFRIAAEKVDEETFHIWQRERIGPAYTEAMVPAETAQGAFQAATFIADHGSELIDAALTFEEQVEYSATGEGFLGTSLDYIRGIATHFAEMRIEDVEVARLLAAAEARAAKLGIG
ncbi:MAG: gamma-glutamylcyclotransferase [Rhodobacteraceae bacterium]|nr:gamma-glutamylcyclotransferase [Paracoccaceae bacterium]